MSTTGGPAFSVNGPNGDWPGMALRDYFAAKALPSLIVDGSSLEAIKLAAAKSGLDGMACTAIAAYAYADAMLKAREA